MHKLKFLSKYVIFSVTLFTPEQGQGGAKVSSLLRQLNLALDATRPVLGVSDKANFKPVSSAIESS